MGRYYDSSVLWRSHVDMHCFRVGSVVIRVDDNYKTPREVVAIRGAYKDDHIKLETKDSPWMIAGEYEKVRQR